MRTTKRFGWRTVGWAALLLLLALTLLLAQTAYAAHKKRVLIISSYHPAFPTFFEQINGVKSVFEGKSIELDIEFMDSKRFYDETNLENFYNSLSYKLSRVAPYNAIIVTDDNALAFLLKHQAELFANTPIIFLGVNNIENALEQNNNPTVTGIVEAVSMADTIELMMQLTSNVSTIYAIVDDTPSGQSDLTTYRKLTQNYKDPGINFSELSLTELTYPELATKLEALDENSAALLLSAYRDSAGTALDFDDHLQLITHSLNRPLYHLWYHGMGDGVLGGKLISHFEQGKTAAEITLQILEGQPVAEIPVLAQSPNRYIFDYNEMEKFNVKDSDLPPGSIVLNRPETFYAKYKTLVWIVSGAFLILGMLVILLSINIINLRRARTELLLSDEILKQMPDAIILTDMAGNIRRWMGKAKQIFGYSAAEVNGRRLNLIHQSEAGEGMSDKIFDAIQKNGKFFGEVDCIKKDGTDIPIELTAATVLNESGTPIGLISVNRDIFRRKQAEEKARRHNQELKLLNRVITASAAESDMKSLLETVCRELAQVYGVPQAAAALINKSNVEAVVVAEYLGKGRPSSLNDTIPIENNPIYTYLIEQKKPLAINDARTDPRMAAVQNLIEQRGIVSLLLIPLIIDDEVVGSLGIDSIKAHHFTVEEINLAQSVAHQVSGALARAKLVEEREILKEQYFQAQKMESLGRLTGGVAHDFNNLLTAINGFAELIQMQLPGNDPLQNMVDKILHSGRRAADLVSQLLAFSRKQIIEPQTLDLNVTIGNMEQMLRRVINENIHLKTNTAATPCIVKVDPTQIEQVIINLTVNARDAMPEGGYLTIATKNITLNNTYTPNHPDVEPGNYVMLTVADTGVGMNEELIAHIFEPFFTTKEVGKGTGLGLATTFGTIKQNRGDIQVHSTEGKGTTFRVYLPDASDSAVSRDLPQTEKGGLPNGQETILLVEDDQDLRKLAHQMLSRQGYFLLEASSGPEALEIARHYPDAIHLLLTDVIMPEMSGKKIAEQLKTGRPGLKVLLMSGYTGDIISQHNILDSGFAFLQKPFSLVALTHKVRQTLDAT